MISSVSFTSMSCRKIFKELPQVTLRHLRTSAMALKKTHGPAGLLKQLYAQEDSVKILDFLNNTSIDQLKKERLVSERLRHLIIKQRPFQSLSDILMLPRMDIVQAERLCKLVLRDDDKKPAHSEALTCHPKLEQAKAFDIKTVTSIRIDGKYSSWLTMTDNLEFLQAGIHRMECSDRNINLCKYDHMLYFDTVRSLVQQLPPSDVFLLFQPKFRLVGKTPLAAAVQNGRNLLEATFSTMILSQGGSSVHAINYSFIASLFNINIGSEMVNVEMAADKLIESGVWKHHKLIALETLQRQRQSVKSKHDPYAILLLQCVGFLTDILYTARQCSNTEPG